MNPKPLPYILLLMSSSLLSCVLVEAISSALGMRDGPWFVLSVIVSAGTAVFAWLLMQRRLHSVFPWRDAAAIQSMTDGVLLLDRRNRIVRVNPAGESMLERSARSLLGRSVFGAFRDRPELTRICESGEAPYTVLVRDRGGNRSYTAAHLVPLKSARGEALGRLITLRDFTRRKRAEETLQESERRFRELADYLPLTVFETDARGTITFVNKTGLEQFGYGSDALELGLSFLGLVAPNQQDAARRALESALAGLSIETEEFTAIRNDKSTFPSVISARPVYQDGITDGVGARATFRVVVGIRGFAIDLSSRKQAEVERERLLFEVQSRAAEMDALLAAIPIALVVFDATGRIVSSNRHANSILGEDISVVHRSLPDRLASLGMMTVAGGPLSMEDSPPMRALAGKVTRDATCVIHPPGGDTLCVSMSAAPIRGPGDEISGAFVTFADVTELLDLQQQRDDIARAVSHDLRTPLTVILGHGKVLQMALAKAGNDRWKENIDSIVLACQQMNSMIQDLVDSMRMESGQLELEKTIMDLPTMMIDLKQRLAGVLETERIRIAPHGSVPLVSADPDRVERIMTNLVSNALKYSDPSTDVVVTFQHVGREVVTTVIDDGYGIPEEMQPRLFQRYSRHMENGRRRDSLGLGLYITKGLVEAHGGRVWAESRVGEGSKFSFTMPVCNGKSER